MVSPFHTDGAAGMKPIRLEKNMARIKPQDLWKQLDRSVGEASRLYNREQSTVQGKNLVSMLAGTALVIGAKQQEESAGI